mmetsp:Transcript_25779/g.39927  ORF Transcript_25779/g.39927 Transcript_25779/m.39927 type:complete len:101 (+) Transcript_25779:159-461(+)
MTDRIAVMINLVRGTQFENRCRGNKNIAKLKHRGKNRKPISTMVIPSPKTCVKRTLMEQRWTRLRNCERNTRNTEDVTKSSMRNVAPVETQAISTPFIDR